VKLPMVEAQAHRRVLKTHLPVDALVFSPEAKYVYVGRDGRDIVWSMYNHHARANQFWYDALNNTPGRVGPPIEPPPSDIRQYFRDWMEYDGHPFWPFWENVRSWLEVRGLPNVLFVHFADLKQGMPKEMRRIAEFLDVSLDEGDWEEMIEYCSFGWMKRNAEKVVPLGGAAWDEGAQVFIHQGVNGRWADTLTLEDVSEYEAKAVRELGPQCARWLAMGEQAGSQSPSQAS
jgi:aryl sulfotransferase